MERILYLYLNAIAQWTFNNLFAILGGTIFIALVVTTCVNRLHLGRIQTRRQLRHEPLRLHIRKL